MTNNGDLGLEVDRVSISWPTAFGNLKEMKADGTFFKGALSPPSAVVDSGWDGNVDDRTIKPGDTKTFEFKFANDVSLVGDVDIVVNFTAGCTIQVDYQAPFSGGDWACDKPIDALTMIWDGPSGVNVTAWKGSVGSTNLGTVNNVSTGDKVTFTGFAGSAQRRLLADLRRGVRRVDLPPFLFGRCHERAGGLWLTPGQRQEQRFRSDQ